MADLQSARDALSRQGEVTGRLRLTAPMSFGGRISRRCWRSWRSATRGSRSTPPTATAVDLVGEGFDAAIRLGNLADLEPDRPADRADSRALVASPGYLARAGTPRTPAELAGHETVPHGDDLGVPPRGKPSPTGRAGGSPPTAAWPSWPRVAAGLGIAAMPAFLAGPALERGELVRLLDDYAIPEAGMYVVRPPPAEPVPMKIKVLRPAAREVRRLGRLRPRGGVSGFAPRDHPAGPAAGEDRQLAAKAR